MVSRTFDAKINLKMLKSLKRFFDDADTDGTRYVMGYACLPANNRVGLKVGQIFVVVVPAAVLVPVVQYLRSTTRQFYGGFQEGGYKACGPLN